MNLEDTVTWLKLIVLSVYNPEKKKKRKMAAFLHLQSTFEDCQSEFCDIKATKTKMKYIFVGKIYPGVIQKEY